MSAPVDLSDSATATEDTAYGYTLSAWLDAAGRGLRDLSESRWDLRAAWRAGENPADYASDECDTTSSYHASGACSCVDTEVSHA